MTELLVAIAPQAELIWTSKTTRQQDCTSTGFDEALRAAEAQFSQEHPVRAQGSAEDVQPDRYMAEDPVCSGGHGSSARKPASSDAHRPNKAESIPEAEVAEDLGRWAEAGDEADECTTVTVGRQIVLTYVSSNPLATSGCTEFSSPEDKRGEATSKPSESGHSRIQAPGANRLLQYGVATRQTSISVRKEAASAGNRMSGAEGQSIRVNRAFSQELTNGGPDHPASRATIPPEEGQDRAGNSGTAPVGPRGYQAKPDATSVYGRSPSQIVAAHSIQPSAREVGVSVSHSKQATDGPQAEPRPVPGHEPRQAHGSGAVPVRTSNPLAESVKEQYASRVDQPIVQEASQSKPEACDVANKVDLGSNPAPGVRHGEEVHRVRVQQMLTAQPMSGIQESHHASISDENEPSIWGTEVPGDLAQLESEMSRAMSLDPNTTLRSVRQVRSGAFSPRAQAGGGPEAAPADPSWADSKAMADNAWMSRAESLDDAVGLNGLHRETMQSVRIRALSDLRVKTVDSLHHNPVEPGRADTEPAGTSTVNHGWPGYGSVAPHLSTSLVSIDAAEPKPYEQSGTRDLQPEAAPVSAGAGSEVKVRQARAEDEHSRAELARDPSVGDNTAAEQGKSSFVARREAQTSLFRWVRQRQEGVHQSSGRGVLPQVYRGGYLTDRDFSVRMDAILMPQSHFTDSESAGAFMKADMPGDVEVSESAGMILAVQSGAEIKPSSDPAKDIPAGGRDYPAGSPEDEIVVKATRAAEAMRNHAQVSAVNSRPSIGGSLDSSGQGRLAPENGYRSKAQASPAETESRPTVPSRPAAPPAQARVERLEAPGSARLELPEPVVSEEVPMQEAQDGRASSRMSRQYAMTEAEKVSAVPPPVNVSGEAILETRGSTKAGINAGPQDKAVTEFRAISLEGSDLVPPVAAAEMQSRTADSMSGYSAEPIMEKPLTSRALMHERPAPNQDWANRASDLGVTPMKPVHTLGPVELGQSAAGRVNSDIIDQIVKHAGFRVNENGGELRIELVPEQLGRVEMRVRVAGGICTASVRVENAEVGKYLQQHVAELKTSMIEHGVNIGVINVFIGSEGRDSRERRYMDHGSSQNPVTYPSYRQPKKPVVVARVKTSLIDYIA